MLDRAALIGTVGVPAKYGGFETLVEQLCRINGDRYVVYCEKAAYLAPRAGHYFGAELVYVPLRANGISSLFYDAYSILHAIVSGHRTLLMLGVSGAWILPFVRYVPGLKIVTNIDGLEWKRSKWGRITRYLLKLLEYLAVKFSGAVVADNEGILRYIEDEYGLQAVLITYGGDHAIVDTVPSKKLGYALMMCRIEPENNVGMILEAFSVDGHQLVAVGNWEGSRYGRNLREKYSTFSNIKLMDPVYDERFRFDLRSKASLYVHGHQAGGTNPALVEMMYFGIPVLAFDCDYNRYSTENCAAFFSSVASLKGLLRESHTGGSQSNLLTVAKRKHKWSRVSELYQKLLF